MEVCKVCNKGVFVCSCNAASVNNIVRKCIGAVLENSFVIDNTIFRTVLVQKFVAIDNTNFYLAITIRNDATKIIIPARQLTQNEYDAYLKQYVNDYTRKFPSRI